MITLSFFAVILILLDSLYYYKVWLPVEREWRGSTEVNTWHHDLRKNLN
jgi:hypothetical protein